MMKSAWFVLYTELLLLLRRSQEWLYPVGFFIMMVSLFPIAFSPDPVFLQKYLPGCVWIAALLSSLLSVQTLFLIDMEEGYLEQVILSPLPLSVFVICKLIANWIATALPLIILTPLLGILFHVSLNVIIGLVLSLLIGTPILLLVGAFSVSLTLGLRQQGILLGILMLPLVVPVLIFGVNIAQLAQAHFSVLGPALFLGGLSMLAISLLPYVIAVTIRISCES